MLRMLSYFLDNTYEIKLYAYILNLFHIIEPPRLYYSLSS